MKKSSKRTYIWRCCTFNVRHTKMTEHIESVAVLPNVLHSYYMCCFLTQCVADPIRGVCRSSYTLLRVADCVISSRWTFRCVTNFFAWARCYLFWVFVVAPPCSNSEHVLISTWALPSPGTEHWCTMRMSNTSFISINIHNPLPPYSITSLTTYNIRLAFFHRYRQAWDV